VRLEQTTATGLETARRRCLRRVLERYLGRAAFRVIHVSIQKNHLHLLVEAADRRALTAGMQSFAINAARALDADPHGVAREARARVRAQQLAPSPPGPGERADARREAGSVCIRARVHRMSQQPRFATPAGYKPLSVSAPTTALLQFDWQRFGLIDLHETPGPRR